MILEKHDANKRQCMQVEWQRVNKILALNEKSASSPIARAIVAEQSHDSIAIVAVHSIVHLRSSHLSIEIWPLEGMRFGVALIVERYESVAINEGIKSSRMKNDEG